MQKISKKIASEKNIQKFSQDTKKLGGYVYTSNQKLSSQIANEYQTVNTLKLINPRGKSIIDIGCGDGTYTNEVFLKGKPKQILGIDPSDDGIAMAKKRYAKKNLITFKKGSIYDLPVGEKYDIAIVRGVLHHLYNPEKAFPEINRVAKKVIIIEPNGYNPVLKIIEKTSKYHIDHEEKSYPPYKLDIWIRQNKGKIIQKKYLGFVPFFCPDSLAKILKIIEPVIESLPLINCIACGNYYIVYKNEKNK